MRRRTWLTLGAVVLGGAGAVTVAVANQSGGHDVDPRPAKVFSLDLQGTGSTKRQLPRTETETFSMLGVTWRGAKTRLKGTAQVRTHSSETDEWSPWKDLDLGLHLPDKVKSGMRGTSDPLWVGPSDAVEARVTAADGSETALPKGLRLDLVDPGVTKREAAAASRQKSLAAAPVADSSTLPSDSATPTDTATATSTETATAPATETTTAAPADTSTATATDTATASPTDSTSASPSPTVPTAPPSTVTRPPIIDRATWGADESLVEDPPNYLDKISAVFVHHTVGTNEYSCADSPALVRGIFEYHVKTNGWNDLGYNFLVDKCGNIFEGRAGGIDLPVYGAHTYGFNSYSVGIAMLGDFQDGAGKPMKAALEAVGRVAAWKLGQYGGDPTGKVTLTALEDTGVWNKGEQATLNTISGHRDAYATECPGENLYAKLGDIRRFAASPGANSAVPTADFNHDGIPDLVAGTPGVSGGGSRAVVPGGTEGPVAESKRTLTQSSAGIPGASESGDNFGADNAWGDVNGDGYADLAIGSPGEDDTSGHGNTGAVTVAYGPGLDSGKMYTTSASTRASGEKLGTSVTVGDFNSDGKADVFSVAPGKPGRWWSFDGETGAEKSGYLGSSAYTSDIYSYSVDSATGDFNRDGYADVVVNFRDPSKYGRVLVLKGSASGLQRVGILGVKGGRSVAVGDVNGDGYADAVVGQPYASESSGYRGGQVTAFYGSSSGLTTSGRTTIHQDTSGVPGVAENGDAMGWSIAVGDYNRDGYADVLAGVPREDIGSRTDAGMVVLLRGSSSGLTGSGAQALHQDSSGIAGVAEAGDWFGSAVVLNDLSGWSRADLAIGAMGENNDDGTILQLDSGSSGVSTDSEVYYGRTELGTPAGARLGRPLAP